jgi:hypothetical protein
MQFIHAKRLAGLYVESSSDGALNIPSAAVSPRQATALIGLANALVQSAETQIPREDIPSEELERQKWFLNAMDDPEIRKTIFNERTIARLRELNDITLWTREIRAEIESENESLRELAQRELNRMPSPDDQSKERWKIRIRLETSSNSIRPAFMKSWNDNVNWIKCVPVQGERKKDHLIVEFTLGDNISTKAIWPVGFTLSLRFVMAMNLATSGFWWWQLSPNRTKFSESIYDLDTRHGVELEAGDFQVFEKRVALTEVHANTLVMCFTALPNDPRDPKRKRESISGISRRVEFLGGQRNHLALRELGFRSILRSLQVADG